MVRVLIKEGTDMVSITGGGEIEISTDRGISFGTYPIYDGRALDLSIEPAGIKINNSASTNSTALILKPIDRIPPKVGKYAYRGETVINLNNQSQLEVINLLDLEEYIKGLMKMEISPDWPHEALKAQAVVARTYALYQINQNKEARYDLKASAESQVYIGVAGEDPRTDNAVDMTKGLVLISGHEILPALYHACCGGHTEEAKNVFNDHPSLCGVSCHYCLVSPHYSWEKEISFIKLRNLFLCEAVRMGPISSVTIMEKTLYNRVETVLITHSLGQEVINGTQLRALLGYDLMRSTLFTIVNLQEGVSFKGKGWGHGVGLCQWGAMAMAEQGANYRHILTHYYPKAKIEKRF